MMDQGRDGIGILIKENSKALIKDKPRELTSFLHVRSGKEAI